MTVFTLVGPRPTQSATTFPTALLMAAFCDCGGASDPGTVVLLL